MPAVTDASLVQLGTDLIFNNFSFFDKVFFTEHWCPLERGERFRHKERSADIDLYFSFTLLLWNNFIIGLGNLLGKMCDALHIIFCFSRKSKHEIKLNLIPSALESFTGAVQDIFFRKSFINNITKTLRTCFRSKSEAAFFDILNFTHNIESKCIDSKRRQRNIDCLITEFINQEVHDLFQVTVITGT